MYEYERRIGGSQMGADGLATLGAVVDMLQDCSLWWLQSEPAFVACIHEQHLAMMVGSRQVEVVRYPAYSEHVRVRTTVYTSKPRIGYRNTFIYDEAGEAIVKSWCVGTYVSLDTGAIVALPKEVADSVVITPKQEMSYLPHKIKLPEGQPQVCEPVPVRQDDIDMYQHMNNVSYIRLANELTPPDSRPRGMRIEHKGQARLGDRIFPQVYRDGDATIINLAQADGTPYAIVEFTV